MNIRKISLVLSLLLSVCFVYAQSYIDVEVRNNTQHEYECSVQFNQAVIPNPGSSPTVFTIPANTTYTAKYEFNAYDVNLDNIKCIWTSGGQSGFIDVSYGYTSVDVAPQTGNPLVFNEFEYWDYIGQGTSEVLKFKIEQ